MTHVAHPAFRCGGQVALTEATVPTAHAEVGGPGAEVHSQILEVQPTWPHP
jgi:hypothetical protein